MKYAAFVVSAALATFPITSLARPPQHHLPRLSAEQLRHRAALSAHLVAAAAADSSAAGPSAPAEALAVTDTPSALAEDKGASARGELFVPSNTDLDGGSRAAEESRTDALGGIDPKDAEDAPPGAEPELTSTPPAPIASGAATPKETP